MKFFSRSSRATGPKMRVPRGLRWLSMITAAFSSNAIDVPGHLETGLLLDHFAASTISARRQFFVFDSGRVSTMRTTSPTLAVFASSCAWNLVERRITFL